MATNDPMQSAIETSTFSSDLYGKIEVSAKYVYTAKGERPRDFIDGQDDPKKRSTEIALSLTTIDALGLTRPVIERKHLNWTPAWGGVWESIKALGCDDLYALTGKYVKVEMVGTGRHYKDKTGTDREETAMKFLAIYDSESACVKAYESDAGVSPSASDALRAEWADTIDTLVTISKGDMTVLAKKLKAAGSPFDVESDLVTEILKSQAVAA
jgi:hypothetical protein